MHKIRDSWLRTTICLYRWGSAKGGWNWRPNIWSQTIWITRVTCMLVLYAGSGQYDHNIYIHEQDGNYYLDSFDDKKMDSCGPVVSSYHQSGLLD